MARLEANIGRLIENFFSALFTKLNETRYPEGKIRIPKTNGSRNFLIPISEKQIEDNTVGDWLSCLIAFRLQTNSLRN